MSAKILRYSILVCLAWLLTACDSKVQAPAPSASYEVIDLMPDFWAFWRAAEGQPIPKQQELLNSMLVQRHPEVYTADVLTLDKDVPLEAAFSARYERWLPLISPHIQTMENVSARIAADLPQYESSFRAVFPDMNYAGRVYFLCSFGGFDGAVRTVNGSRALLFGVDMISYVYGEHADAQPFFHHELFHIYHSQFLPEDDERLFLSLWREGLATYVAKSLNASAAGVNLFGLPLDMPQRAQALLPQLARELRENLDSTSPDVYAKFFFGKSDSADASARSAYYVGYLLAQKVGEGKSLRELARMPPADVRVALERGLRELETVPP